MSVGASQRQLVRQLRLLPAEALLIWMNSASDEDVITALYFGKPAIRAVAARTLGTRSNADLDIYLADSLYADSLYYEDDSTVIEALFDGLAARRTPKSIQALVNYADRSIWRLRARLIQALTTVPLDGAIPTLIDLLADSVPKLRYPGKHIVLVEMLASTGRADVFDALVECARTTTNAWLPNRLAEAICKFDDPRVMTTIGSLLEANIPRLSVSIAGMLKEMVLPAWMLPVLVRTICKPKADSVLVQACVIALGQFKSYDAVVLIDGIRTHAQVSRHALETALLTLATPEALVVWMLSQEPDAPTNVQGEISSHSPIISRRMRHPTNAPGLPDLYRLARAFETLRSREWQCCEAASQTILNEANPAIYQHLIKQLSGKHGDWLTDTIMPLWIMDILAKANYPAVCTAIGQHANLATVAGIFAIRALKSIHARYPCLHCEALLQDLAYENQAKSTRSNIERIAHQELATILPTSGSA